MENGKRVTARKCSCRLPSPGRGGGGVSGTNAGSVSPIVGPYHDGCNGGNGQHWRRLPAIRPVTGLGSNRGRMVRNHGRLSWVSQIIAARRLPDRRREQQRERCAECQPNWKGEVHVVIAAGLCVIR